MKKIISMLLITLMIITTSCSTQQSVKTESPEKQVTTTKPLPTTDMAGNSIKVPEKIEKIVSMAPSITEILIELGHGDKIVAADVYSKGIAGLPANILYIDMLSPDAEKIISLNPDIILASGMSMKDGNNPFKPISDVGICVAYIPSSQSIGKIYEDILFISGVVRADKKGEEIVANMKNKINEYKKKSESVKQKKKVYFEISAAPTIYSFGTGVFLDEIITIIGAENVLSDQKSWISISDEVILSKNPDVIITNVSFPEDPLKEIKSRSGWENIDAIKNNQVYRVDTKRSSQPNHNIIKALEEIGKAVYPEIY